MSQPTSGASSPQSLLPGVVVDAHDAVQQLSLGKQVILVNVINAALPTRHLFNIGHFTVGDSLALTVTKVVAFIVRMAVEWCLFMPVVLSIITCFVVPLLIFTAIPTAVTAYDNRRKANDLSWKKPDRTFYIRYFNLTNLFRREKVDLVAHHELQIARLERRVDDLEDRDTFALAQNEKTKVNFANALLPSRHIFGCKLLKAGEGKCMRTFKVVAYVLLLITEWVLFLPLFMTFIGIASIATPLMAIPTIVTAWDSWMGGNQETRSLYVRYCSWQNVSSIFGKT